MTLQKFLDYFLVQEVLWIQANFMPFLQRGYQLRAGAVGSGPNHLQAGDMLGADSGDGLYTHAAQIRVSTFRVCRGWDAGAREGPLLRQGDAWQEHQP